MDCSFRVEMADNGFVLNYDDPEIREKNRGDEPWEDPSRRRVYSTTEALMADINKLVPIMAEFAAKQDDDVMDADEQYKTALSTAFSE